MMSGIDPNSRVGRFCAAADRLYQVAFGVATCDSERTELDEPLDEYQRARVRLDDTATDETGPVLAVSEERAAAVVDDAPPTPVTHGAKPTPDEACSCCHPTPAKAGENISETESLWLGGIGAILRTTLLGENVEDILCERHARMYAEVLSVAQAVEALARAKGGA